MSGLEEQILAALGTSDRNQGELKDLTGLEYPVLNSALARLSQAKKIEHYFTETEIPVLTYRLARSSVGRGVFWR